jgi:hypothetical protein
MHSDDEFYDATVSKIVSKFGSNHKQKGCMEMVFMCPDDGERLIRNRIGGIIIMRVKAGWLPLASHGIF